MEEVPARVIYFNFNGGYFLFYRILYDSIIKFYLYFSHFLLYCFQFNFYSFTN
jgi:hypothetical protein